MIEDAGQAAGADADRHVTQRGVLRSSASGAGSRRTRLVVLVRDATSRWCIETDYRGRNSPSVWAATRAGFTGVSTTWRRSPRPASSAWSIASTRKARTRPQLHKIVTLFQTAPIGSLSCCPACHRESDDLTNPDRGP